MPSLSNSPKAKAQRERYAADPAYREMIKARCRAHYANHTPEQKTRYRATRRKAGRKALGILDATGEAKVGECPICLRQDTKLLCDHDHQTGKIRGWLCILCNTWLGPTDDGRAKRAVEYLAK